ncbi:MAG: hypothetical protein SV765_00220 [Pseudomonadota bacterium]|nr:hypothetical protein [Pseudomonadota bacterium]
MSEILLDFILYFYCGNAVIAFFSYMSQQKILIDMIRGKRPPSKDVSGSQFWVWTAANGVTTLYSIFIVQNELPLIVLSSINFGHSFLTALLNSYVHYLCNKRK